ncbi:MAG: hypothetical protein R3229_00060 [Alphaproteobacteria bacterium]|nr:hypothetical protein [Alphaproteobacteria bacterium]
MEKSTEIDGVIVEFHRVGNAVKVSAVCTRTYVEVSIMAPATCSEHEMTQTVLRKLAYVQEKGDRGRPAGRNR